MTHLNQDTVIEYGIVTGGGTVVDVGQTSLGSFIRNNLDDLDTIIDVVAGLARQGEPQIGGGAQPLYRFRLKKEAAE